MVIETHYAVHLGLQEQQLKILRLFSKKAKLSSSLLLCWLNSKRRRKSITRCINFWPTKSTPTLNVSISSFGGSWFSVKLKKQSVRVFDFTDSEGLHNKFLLTINFHYATNAIIFYGFYAIRNNGKEHAMIRTTFCPMHNCAANSSNVDGQPRWNIDFFT